MQHSSEFVISLAKPKAEFRLTNCLPYAALMLTATCIEIQLQVHVSTIKILFLLDVSSVYPFVFVFCLVHPFLFSPGILFLVHASYLRVYESLEFQTLDSQEDLMFH